MSGFSEKMYKYCGKVLFFAGMFISSVHPMSSNVSPQTKWGDATPPVMCRQPVVSPFDHAADATANAPILSIDVLGGAKAGEGWLHGLEVVYLNKRLTTLTETRAVQKVGTAIFTADDPLVEIYGSSTTFLKAITEIYFKSLSGRVFGPFCQRGGAKGGVSKFSLRGAPNTSIIGFKGVNKNNEYGTWYLGMLEIITAPLSGSSLSVPAPLSSNSSSGPSQVASIPSQPLPATSTPIQASMPSQVPQSASVDMQSDILAFFNAINGNDWFALKSILGKYESSNDNLRALLTAQQVVTNEKINGVMTTPLHLAVSKNNSYFATLIMNSASTIGKDFLKGLILQRDGDNKQPIDYADPNSSLAVSLRYRMSN